MKNEYDYLVIGSGPAGHTSAIKASQAGLKVAVIERDSNMVGGVCLNEGCIPAKSLFYSAKIFNLIKKNSELFAGGSIPKEIDMPKLISKSRGDALKLQKGLTFVLKKNNIDLIIGSAEFEDSKTLKVTLENGETSVIKADNFLIATGSYPKDLPNFKFDRKKIMTSSEAIRLTEIPKKVLIAGGGAIGTEFASFFNLLGSDVSIAEIQDSLLPGEDKEVSRALETIFKKKGIKVLTLDATKELVQKASKGEMDYDVILVSVGRAPLTGTCSLDKAGVKLDEDGFIPVDEKMRTNIKNIYAAGDVLKTPMLAHVAAAEGEAAALNILGENSPEIDYSAVPNAVYTDIQVASIGITEEKAKEDALEYSAGKQFFRAGGKAIVNSQLDGFIKIIADTKTHKILGVHIVGPEATEIIHEFAVAKRAGLKVEDISDTIHAHPTFSETALDAARAVFGKPLIG